MTDDVGKDSVIEQLQGHWEWLLRPRLDGLSDAEYLWEPVPDCWSIRRRSEATTEHVAGAGEWVLEYSPTPLDPAPVTTIAWRMGHLVFSCIGARLHSQFDGPAVGADERVYVGTAEEALAQLDRVYDAWLARLKELPAAEFSRPTGPSEGPFADTPLLGLVQHINREVIHHGAEICLLRDLYLRLCRPNMPAPMISAPTSAK